MEINMTWNFTLLVVNLTAFVCVLGLFKEAPCFVQKLAIGTLSVALLVHAITFALIITSDFPFGPLFRRMAYVMEHLSVLLIVFRLSYKEWLNARPHNSRIGDRAIN
jgi:hypothetical protein